MGDEGSMDTMNGNKLVEAFNLVSIFGVFIYQEDGKIVYANERFAKILEYADEEELKGTCMFDFIADHKEEIKGYAEKRLKGEIFSKEFRTHYYLSKTGRIVPVEIFAYTTSYNGKPSGIVIVIDKTKEKTFEVLYYALADINKLIVQEEDEDGLFNKICELLVNGVGYDTAIVGFIDKDDKLLTVKHIKSHSKEKEEAFLKIPLGVDSGTPYGRGSVSKAYHTKKVSLVSSVTEDHDLSFYMKFHDTMNINSSCSIPILKSGEVEYILLIFDSERDTFSKEYISLFEDLQTDLSFALEKIESRHFSGMILNALNHGFDFVGIMDFDFKMLYLNQETIDLLGYSMENVIGRHHSVFSSRMDGRNFGNDFYGTLRSGSTFSGILTYKSKNGSFIKSYTTVIPFKTKGVITNYIAIGKDVTANQSIYEQLENLLHYDGLTGLINKKSFEEKINLYIQNLSSDKIGLGAVLTINPLSLTGINEAFGFEKGNLILKLIGKRIQGSVRGYDVTAKLESDRFGIFIKDVRGEEDIAVIAANLINDLSKPYRLDEHIVTLAFNIGVSMYPKDAEEPLRLIDKAIVALSDAKTKGENSVGFYSPDFEQKARDTLALRTDLDLAIANKEFLLYYQPFVDKDFNITGAESLLRWRKGEKIIPPMDFIPYLEKSGLIVEVERITYGIYLRMAARAQALGFKFPISINFSYNTLKQKDLIGILSSEPSYLNIDKNILHIEMIERSLIEDFSYAHDIMKQLKEEGFGFLIDDFGTGYSSLSYLAQLPVDFLKIDMSFTKKIESDEHTRAIVESIIFIAKRLGIGVVSEGIETPGQFEILTKMGCDYFQGFLFSKPVPEEEFIKLLKNGRIPLPA